MAITLVGAQGEERFAEIETKISALPELDAVTTGDISAITEVEEMILMAQKEGADITKIANIEKFNELKRYKKVVKVRKTYYVHDEENQAKTGDVVRIAETRPLSKLKRWRLVEIVSRPE